MGAVITRLSQILNRNLGQAFEKKGRQSTVAGKATEAETSSPVLNREEPIVGAKIEEAGEGHRV